MRLKAFLISVLVVSCPLVLGAQTPDSTYVEFIDSASVVVGHSRTDGIKGSLGSGLEVSVKSLEKFPKVLGTSDPFKFIQSLAGVSTNTDYNSGLLVQGCDIGHSFTRLCEAPVFGHGHILGFFSVFNTAHFEKMDFSMNSSYGNIGGIVSLDTGGKVDKFSGEANLGLVSTHFSVSVPVTEKSSVVLSARRSFIDLFYKNLITIDNVPLDYRLFDVNVSYIYELDKSNLLDANFYIGNDKTGDIGSLVSGYKNRATWGDIVGNVRWRHSGGNYKLMVQMYGSRFSSDIKFMSPTLDRSISNGISDFGIQARAEIGNSWQAGLSLDSYNILPDGNCAFLGSLDLGWKGSFGDWLVSAGLRPALFKDFESGKTRASLDPHASAVYEMYHSGRVKLDLGIAHQYLFYTGPTSGGFPTEFWLTAGKYSDPQYSHFINLGYELDFFGGMYQLSANTYFRKLWNQLEYVGSVLDVVTDSYLLDNKLKYGEGLNYGAYVMIQKTGGNLTGWVSYNFGRSLRSIDGSELFPSSHERIHELKGVATYRLKRWEFGTNIVFASGQPFTPAVMAYMLNNKMLLQYGKINSCSLAPYFRWDISVSFDIRDEGRFRDGINISVQNVTARKNQYIPALKIKDGQYSYSPVFLIIPVLPSINYYCSF